jgi:deazaflavin-dependent oxidoreductase (nitroreductase family)
VLSGLKTWLETGELLTTPGSLMYTSRELGPRMPDGDPTSPRYVQPGWFTRHVFNPTVALLTRAGVSVWGSRELRVRGRSTGEWRTTPVNLLTLDGEQFLVAPRGHTQWVRNLRVAGTGELRVGRHTDEFDATEIDDAEKVPILRAYLKRWKAEVGVFFDGVSADSSDDELRRIAPDHPVFRVHLTPR